MPLSNYSCPLGVCVRVDSRGWGRRRQTQLQTELSPRPPSGPAQAFPEALEVKVRFVHLLEVPAYEPQAGLTVAGAVLSLLEGPAQCPPQQQPDHGETGAGAAGGSHLPEHWSGFASRSFLNIHCSLCPGPLAPLQVPSCLERPGLPKEWGRAALPLGRPTTPGSFSRGCHPQEKLRASPVHDPPCPQDTRGAAPR